MLRFIGTEGSGSGRARVRPSSMRREESEKNGTLACIFGTLPPLRGISAHFEALVRALSSIAPIEIAVFSRIYPEGLFSGSSTVVDSQEETNLAINACEVDAFAPMSFVRTLRRIRAGIFHFHWWNPLLSPSIVSLLILTRIRRRKAILTLHNLRANEFPTLDSIFLTIAMKLAHAIIVHDEAGLRGLENRFHGLVRVIRPGTLGSPLRSREEARQELGIDDNVKTVLFFGNIRRYKGLDVLLRAFRRLKARQDVLLIVAGDCWEDWRTRYQGMVEEMGPRARIFLGYQPSSTVDVLFSAADVVVLPYLRFSAQSGVGTLALEYGCPLVVTNVGGLPELAEDPRSVCIPGDPDSLAETLEHILDDPELLEELRESSAKTALKFSWKATAEAHLKLYQEVTSSKPVQY